MSPEELERMLGRWKPAVLVLAASRLGVLAALARKPRSAVTLARSLELDERAVNAVCDALVSLSVLRRTGQTLAVEPSLQALMDESSPATMVHAWEHQWFLLQRWARLDEVVRSGVPLPRHRDDAERTRAFVGGMADLGRHSGAAIWDVVDLSGCSHLVDVGGGPGEHARAALQRFPHLRVTVMDLPEVVLVAQELAASKGKEERLSFLSGDVLAEAVPPCDAVLLSSMLRGYGPDDVRRIAVNVAAGLCPGGLLVVREALWPDESHDRPLSTALMAVNMLLATPAGRCWTATEIESLFGAAGFKGWRLQALDPRTTLVTARFPEA